MSLRPADRPPWLHHQEVRVVRLLMDCQPTNGEGAMILDMAVTSYGYYLWRAGSMLRKAGFQVDGRIELAT